MTPQERYYQINLAFSVPALSFPGKIEGMPVQCLLDSGCILNFLRIFDQLPLKVKTGLIPFNCSSRVLADGSSLLFDNQVNMSGIACLSSQAIDCTFVVVNMEPEDILCMSRWSNISRAYHFVAGVLIAIPTDAQ